MRQMHWGIEEHGPGFSLWAFFRSRPGGEENSAQQLSRPTRVVERLYRCEVQARTRAFYLAEISWLAVVAEGRKGKGVRGKGFVLHRLTGRFHARRWETDAMD